MKRRRKGFTLIELLVVVGIIALLVSILMPALGRAKELANQVKCGTQLSGLGKAIALYMSDNRDLYPRVFNTSATMPVAFDQTKARFGLQAYNNQSTSDSPPRWVQNWNQASGPYAGFWNTTPTSGGCLYLLVKTADVNPEMFLCPSEKGAEPMDLLDAISLNSTVANFDDLQDFRSGCNLSYSYQEPFVNLPNASTQSGCAVMADKSNAYDDSEIVTVLNRYRFGINIDCCPSSPTYPRTGDNGNAGVLDANRKPIFNPDWTDKNPTVTGKMFGNSRNHRTELQNVLFADSHVLKTQSPTVGLNDDNIYTYWPTTAAPTTTGNGNLRIGLWGSTTSFFQLNLQKQDSFLGN